MRAKAKVTIKAVLVTGLLVFASAVPALPQDKPVSVPFKIEQNEIVLPVSVDGKETRLILDTGAVDTALNIGTAKTTGEQKSGRTADGKKISVEIGQAIIEIGGQKFSSQVLMMPKLLDGIGGVVGQNILSHFSKITVDYKQHVVIFEK